MPENRASNEPYGVRISRIAGAIRPIKKALRHLPAIRLAGSAQRVNGFTGSHDAIEDMSAGREQRPDRITRL